MGLLSKVARSGARAAGRGLSRHVLPDSLIPSWKTKKAVASGYSLLKKAARRKKKSAPAPTKTATAKRPAPKAPKQKFDRNQWARGGKLVSVDFSNERPLSRSNSSSTSSTPKRASRLKAQVKDLVRNPRLVVQMHLDELQHDYETKKRRFLSDLRAERAKYPF
jgi:hypothetical protein